MIPPRDELFRDVLERTGCDSCLISCGTNIRYLTGYDGDYGMLALSSGAATLFTNPLYSEHARTAVPPSVEVVEITGTMAPELASSFDWGSRVGYEPAHLTCAEFDRLNRAFSVEFVPVPDVVGSFRRHKRDSEIDAVIRAQRISERVLEETLSLLSEGVTEREIAAEIEYRFRRHGGERVSFDTIVAFGPATSQPHAVPGDRRLRPGDMVLFDMGTVVEGYASDMTRTYIFGEGNGDIRNAYKTVLAAQKAALDGITAGMKCSEADALARRVMEERGCADRFIHSLGHGVGLDVHEEPRLASRSEDILEEGMVVTVEPGVYYPGRFGIRIEDMVTVTADGARNLTDAPKEYRELPV